MERPIRLDNVVPKKETEDEVRRLLERVRLDADAVIDRRPHELSGGQRQRVAIARALASRPSLLVADEPVSMLDVSIRLGVLNLLADLQREEGLGVLYITHDLATARHFSSQIVVMRNGRVVERGPSDEVIAVPVHPYTQLLVRAAPDPRSEPFEVDVDRRLRHPEVRVSDADPTEERGVDGVHWAREWDDDESVARLLADSRIPGKEGMGAA